jgi:hypothetical protein
LAAFVDKAHQQEECPVERPWLYHLQDGALLPSELRAKRPCMTKPRWLNEE